MIRSFVKAVARAAAEIGIELGAAISCGARNRWDRFLGRAEAFAEGRDTALCNAAMLAYDMGHPDVRRAINGLMSADSLYLPLDDQRHPRRQDVISMHVRLEDRDPDEIARQMHEVMKKAQARAVAQRAESGL